MTDLILIIITIIFAGIVGFLFGKTKYKGITITEEWILYVLSLLLGCIIGNYTNYILV